jgi:hypothetical protein
MFSYSLTRFNNFSLLSLKNLENYRIWHHISLYVCWSFICLIVTCVYFWFKCNFPINVCFPLILLIHSLFNVTIHYDLWFLTRVGIVVWGDCGLNWQNNQQDSSLEEKGIHTIHFVAIERVFITRCKMLPRIQHNPHKTWKLSAQMTNFIKWSICWVLWYICEC